MEITNTFLYGLQSFFKACIYGVMNDLVKAELTEKIIFDLLSGENPDTLATKYECDLIAIHRIMGGSVFSERVKEYLEKDILISGLVAIKNIKKIAGQDDISKATQLKANQWLAEKALEFNRLGVDSDSPATMSQDQLARRIKAMNDEIIKRAKPIDTGVIVNQTIDDML